MAELVGNVTAPTINNALFIERLVLSINSNARINLTLKAKKLEGIGLNI
jgi:hypothetical protein